MGCGHSTCLESASSRAAGDALERLAVELKRTRMDLGAWKWAIVLAHNATQNVLADAAGFDCRKDTKEIGRALSQARLAVSEERHGDFADATNTYTEELRRAIGNDEPTGRLLDFVALWQTVKTVSALKRPSTKTR